MLVVFTAGALLFALASKSTMYEMVQNAYNVTLAGAFVPLVAGAYWKRATTQGALLSIVDGHRHLAAVPTPADHLKRWCRANLLGFFAVDHGHADGLAGTAVMAATCRSRHPCRPREEPLLQAASP
jgi:hypothetical protein